MATVAYQIGEGASARAWAEGDGQGVNPARWDYTWNASGFGYDITDSDCLPLGETTTFVRTNPPNNLVTSVTDRLNQTINFGWDFTRGNLTSLTLPATTATQPTVATTATWTFQYEPAFSQLTVVTAPPVTGDSFIRQTRYTVDPITGNTTSVRDPMGFVRSLSYEKNGDLISATDEMGAVWQFSYTPEGDLQVVADPLENETLYFHDDASRLTGTKDANGKQAHLDYTPLDDVAHVTRYLGSQQVVTGYQYDAEQNLRFLTDPLGRVREWRYDSKNRPIQEIDALGQSTYAFWDQNDNLIKWVDRKGQVGQYSYGAPFSGDRLVSATFYANSGAAPESSYAVTYDSTNHLVSSVSDTTAAGTATFGYIYDKAFRLIEEDWTEPGAALRSVAQTLDELGRRTSMTPNSGSPISYQYDQRDEVTQISQGGLNTLFQYDRAGRMIKRVLPNKVGTAWTFNLAGFLTGLNSTAPDGSAIDAHSYQVDKVGNITQDAANGLTWNYQLDDLYRLTQATLGATAYNWVYDLAGNRLSQTVGSSQTLYGYDANNRMVSVNGSPLTYDANGNLTAYGNETLTWDVRNRMVGLTEPGLTASFVYDYTGRRSSKTINGTHTSLLNDGEDLVAEIANGTTVSTLQSPFVDEPIEHGGLYLTPNHLGSTTTLTDSSGNLAEQYFYLPFGQTWQSAGTQNPFEFTGRESDGTGFYWYRSRYYSPDLGRFLSEDPAQQVDGTNLYAYAGDDPADAVDPTGLVHVEAWVDSQTRIGKAKAYADQGDYIPPSIPPGFVGPVAPTIANGGELLLTINISNRPDTSKGHTAFPADTWVISGVHVPPNNPISQGSGFIYIGLPGDEPFDRDKGFHGTGERPSWRYWTNGCIRCADDDLTRLIYLLWLNGVPVSTRPKAVESTHNTITFVETPHKR